MSYRLTVPVSARDHLSGSAAAPLILVEYGDYQCPSCGQAYPIVKELQQRFGDRLRFVFRNFPLTQVHEHALRAAETAEWAALQGQFWSMHDALFEHQDQLGSRDLLAIATRLGLERHALERAWQGRELIPRIEEDMTSGASSGVSGTPPFFINGVLHEGPWGVDNLARALHRRLGAS